MISPTLSHKRGGANSNYHSSLNQYKRHMGVDESHVPSFSLLFYSLHTPKSKLE